MTAPTPILVTPKGVFARAIGVFFSPRETYADIATRPRPWPAVLLIVTLVGGANYAFLSTAVGQRAWMDQLLTQREAYGFPATPATIADMERMRGDARHLALLAAIVAVPFGMSLLSGLFLVVFNGWLGGTARFKQVFAAVSHAGFIGAIPYAAATPLNYVRETTSSVTTAAALVPMVDDTSFLGLLFGAIDIFYIWSIASVSIGLAVLYKRRAAPIAWTLFAIAFTIVLVLTVVKTVRSGA